MKRREKGSSLVYPPKKYHKNRSKKHMHLVFALLIFSNLMSLFFVMVLFNIFYL